MKVPNAEHTSRPWRIHELVGDFRLEDVWAVPATGGPDDFGKVVQRLARLDPTHTSSPVVNVLFAVRSKLGEALGWDRPGTGLGTRVATLRERLPADLRDGPSGPSFDAAPFTSLYLLDDEWAVEAANETMHGVVHLGWVPDGAGRFRAEMAVYVKPNGWRGAFYMAAIKPFRHLLVYPRLLRELADRDAAGAGDGERAAAQASSGERR